MMDPMMASAGMGGIDDGMLLEGLDAMDPGAVDLGGGTVTCRVCTSEIDAATGDPVGPVTQDNVIAVEQFQTMAGDAQMGGTELDLGMGMAPGGF